MKLLLIPFLLLASCGGSKTTTPTTSTGIEDDYYGMQDIAGYVGYDTTQTARIWIYAQGGNYGNYSAQVVGATHAETGNITYTGFGNFRIVRDDNTIDYWNTQIAYGNQILLDAGELGIHYIQL